MNIIVSLYEVLVEGETKIYPTIDDDESLQ